MSRNLIRSTSSLLRHQHIRVMSTINNTAPSSDMHSPPAARAESRSVAMSVYAQETPEGVGATVRRSIGSGRLRNLSPFLMLDHATIQPNAGFPDHAHRGQSTISYVIDGMMQHEDFLGNKGTLKKGDLQWMTAGKGIMHSEMPLFDPDPAKAVPAVGLQLWVDLPQDKKFCEPSYQERKAEEIVTVYPSDGVAIKVISGESHGESGFVRPVGGCWFFDVKLSKPGAAVFQPLPEGWTGFAYVITGQVQVGDEPFPHDKFNTLVFTSQPGQKGVQLTRPAGPTISEDTHLVLIAGEPLDQRVVQYGPFVLNTAQQVKDAFMDFQLGRNGFEKAPGWESEIGKSMRAGR